MKTCPKEILALWLQHCEFMGWTKNENNNQNDDDIELTPDQCVFFKK